jgi:GSH-dependent disulfide-bond oxidoreductase
LRSIAVTALDYVDVEMIRAFSAGGTVIDLYYWPTPNGWKIAIMLEECGLPYRTIPVDIRRGEQFTRQFLNVSPNNRMPAIIDSEPVGGEAPLKIFESGAIVEYLADKTGLFLAHSGAERYAVLQWVYWQMANLGPMMGNANHFKNYAKRLVEGPEQLTYATRRFVGEVDRLCGVMDEQLAAHRYLASDTYTIADIITWPWASLVGQLIDEQVDSRFPHLQRWIDEVGERPAVQRGRNHHREWGEEPLSDEERRRQMSLLLNQTSASVRAAREAAANR